MSMQQRIERLFKPRTIVVIGGSNRPESLGYPVVANLRDGYKGKVYVVNPKYDEVQGLPCYSRVHKLPEKADWALVCTPPHTLAGIAEECAKAGLAGVVMLTGGDEEQPAEKRRLYERLRQLRRQYGIRIIGPNSYGILQPHSGLRATLAETPVRPGNLALITQSGALGAAVLEWAANHGVGFSHFFSLGAMIDVSHADLVDFLGSDSRTSAILIYMESMQSARRFLSAARAFARSKPILVLKSGRSQQLPAPDDELALLAPTDEIFSAAFRRAGIIRVDMVSQLFNCAQALALQPRPVGPRLAVVTNSAGPGLLATDYLVAQGGQLAVPTAGQLAAIREKGVLVRDAGPPVILGRGASPNCFRTAIQAVLQSDNNDGLLVVYAPYIGSEPEGIARVLGECSKQTRKPVLAAWMGEQSVGEARNILDQSKIPHYRFPESGVDTFLRMYGYHHNLQLLQETPSALPLDLHCDSGQVAAVFAQVRAQERRRLTDAEARQVLAAYGIAANPFRLVRSSAEAVAFAETNGYPVAMKIVSPDIINRTDVGGLRLNLQTPAEIAQAFEDIFANVRRNCPGVPVQGIMVEKMVNTRFELLLSAKRDAVFGPVIVFGRGGRIATLHPDVQLGLPPLNLALARRIIERTRVYSLLRGFRELEGVDLRQLETLLVRFSYLLMDFPDIETIDINPLVMQSNGGLVVDATIAIDPNPVVSTRPYPQLVISPYPDRYQRQLQLRDGQAVLLRPIRPEDEPLAEDMLNRQSRETLYFRFFGQVPKINHQFMTRFTQIDYDREMAIVALQLDAAGNEQEIMGIVRLIADPWREGGEYAILVSDFHKGKGLGLLLTQYIEEIGREMGLQYIHASVLATNQPMIGLFKKCGFSLEREDFETYHVHKSLLADPYSN